MGLVLDSCIYAADVGLMPNSCMWTAGMSLIVNKLEVDDIDANNADADRAEVDLAAGGGLMIDLLVFLLKSESNYKVVWKKANFSLSSYLINFFIVQSVDTSLSSTLYSDLVMLYIFCSHIYILSFCK